MAYFNTFQSQFGQMQQPQQPIGFVPVRGELEARNYPIAPGNSVTFKDETAPYIYTKTMGFSQLDRPIFEKYKLIKEPISGQNEPETKQTDENIIKNIQDEIKALWNEIGALKEQPTPKKKKKEVVEDE